MKDTGRVSVMKQEKAAPGYYEVKLDDYGIKAQLTATSRTGVHKYTFPENCKDGRIILDLIHGSLQL